MIAGGAGNDDVVGGDGDDLIRTGSGDDTIKGGAGDDTIFAGLGDDLLVYDAQGSVGATDRYDGGSGYDTLRLEQTNDILNDQLFLAELALYSSTAGSASQSSSGGTFSFDTLGLTISGIEDIKLFVDDTEVDSANEPVEANDDAAVMVADQDTIYGNVLDNDSVLDGVMELTIGQATAHDVVTLDLDGVFMFMLDPADQTVSALAEGATLTDSFSYEVTDADGDTDMATVSITITVTGENDTPTLSDGTLITNEDDGAVTLVLALLGDDIDQDDDGGSLTYDIYARPNLSGITTIDGTKLTSDLGSDFQGLAVGGSSDIDIGITATDQHGATAHGNVIAIVFGENDAPTLAAVTIAAVEDSPAATLDLANLGDDIDRDDDGGSLVYAIANDPAEGAAAMTRSPECWPSIPAPISRI